MIYLIAIFISPIFFFMRKRWGGFFINSILYITAIITLPIFGIGIFFWFIAVTHAMWHLRKEIMREQARMIAEEINRERMASTPKG